MVWGCFSRRGTGRLVRIPGTMTKEVYLSILQENLRPSAREMKMPRGFIFQQDNDPKHTAKVVKSWFETQKLKVMDWPAQSPDLNPIENLWNELERRYKARQIRPKNCDELFAVLEEEWKRIPLERVQKLVDSLPRRISQVLAAKGGHINY